MCVAWQDEWEEADKDIQAYKIVVKSKDGKYESPLPVDERMGQDVGGSLGTVLTYETGKKVVSEWPGIYLLENAININSPQVLLKVTIPKGTKFRRGQVWLKDTNGRKFTVTTLNAMSIIVGDVRPNQPTTWTKLANTATSSMAWNYVTTSATTTYYSQGVDTT